MVEITSPGLCRPLLPPRSTSLMRHAHNGHQYEPLRLEIKLPACCRYPFRMCDFWVVSYKISLMNQDV
ncbi:hypothetical protein P692DRAFT_20570318 [Suillus brevipes Sb2]|nr:hypothetical protein P692DRAFT_20570318 [Suillus brevipes Sb2]